MLSGDLLNDDMKVPARIKCIGCKLWYHIDCAGAEVKNVCISVRLKMKYLAFDVNDFLTCETENITASTNQRRDDIFSYLSWRSYLFALSVLWKIVELPSLEVAVLTASPYENQLE